MNDEVVDIYLSAESDEDGEACSDKGADVIVQFASGSTYAASFFTYDRIERIRTENYRTGVFLSGKYFWADKMVLIDFYNLENVQHVVQDLLDSGDFTVAFRKL